MGDEDPPEIVHPFGDKRDIRNDEVDSALVLFGELPAAIEQDQVLSALHGGHILADFTDSAERYDAKAIRADRAGSGQPLAIRQLGRFVQLVAGHVAAGAALPARPLMRMPGWLHAVRSLFVPPRPPNGPSRPLLRLGAIP